LSAEIQAAISTYRADIPAAWDELIIDGCLAKPPSDRPANMAKILAALDQLALSPF
jgi:hypothetical protein